MTTSANPTKAESFSCGEPENNLAAQIKQQQQLAESQSGADGSIRHQMASGSSLQAELQVDRQQHLISTSSNVQLLARKSQQLTMSGPSSRKLLGVSLSNEPSSLSLIGMEASSDLSQPGLIRTSAREQVPQMNTNCALPPLSAKLQHQQSTTSSSFKKSNFFQGFRSTLKGRRGSKQQQQQLLLQQQLEQAPHPNEPNSSTIQQSQSLCSISNQPLASKLVHLGASKKIKQKLLHGLIEPTTTTTSPSSASGSSSSTADTPSSGGHASPFFGTRQNENQVDVSRTMIQQQTSLISSMSSSSSTTTATSVTSSSGSSFVTKFTSASSSTMRK